MYTRAVPSQHQTLFFRLAQIVAAAAAVIAGILGARVLGPDGPDYPDNFSRLFLAAAVAAGGVVLLQLLTREPSRIPASARGEGIGSAAAVRGVGLPALADATFRRFLFFRIALGLAAVADPFYILYALRELDIAATRLGWFLLALVAARIVSAPFWAWMNRVHGTRAALQAAGMLRILPPLVAISLPYLIDTDLWRDRVTAANAVPIAFGIVFVAIGFALGGLQTATFGYLVESLPANGRAAAIGLTNLVLAVSLSRTGHRRPDPARIGRGLRTPVPRRWWPCPPGNTRQRATCAGKSAAPPGRGVVASAAEYLGIRHRDMNLPFRLSHADIRSCRGEACLAPTKQTGHATLGRTAQGARVPMPCPPPRVPPQPPCRSSRSRCTSSGAAHRRPLPAGGPCAAAVAGHGHHGPRSGSRARRTRSGGC